MKSDFILQIQFLKSYSSQKFELSPNKVLNMRGLFKIISDSIMNQTLFLEFESDLILIGYLSFFHIRFILKKN